MGCHFLLQGIFPTRGWNPGLPHCRQTLPAEPQGKVDIRGCPNEPEQVNGWQILLHCVGLLLLLLSHFSRVRLCDPTDGRPPGSPVPGILQARTLEWFAISFSNPCRAVPLKITRNEITMKPQQGWISETPCWGTEARWIVRSLWITHATFHNRHDSGFSDTREMSISPRQRCGRRASSCWRRPELCHLSLPGCHGPSPWPPSSCPSVFRWIYLNDQNLCIPASSSFVYGAVPIGASI